MASTLLPLSATFESRVELKLHDAFLATAGVLQADTIAQVELVTVNKRIHFSGGATTTRASTTTTTTSSSSSSAAAGSYRCAYIMNREVMGRTPLRLFTAHPNIETVVAFNVDDNRLATQLAGAGTTTPADAPKHNNNNNMAAVEDFIVITMRDASGQHFYGEAWAPFSPHCANEELQPLRVMLRPRHAHDPHDPLCRQDVAQLIAHQVDDFGFVNVSWKVAMIHRGGVRMAAEAPAEMCGEPSFPLGIALRATWMTPCTALQRGAHHNVSVEFGGAGRFLFAGDDAPLFLTLRSATQAPQRAIFHCTIQSVMSPANSRDVVVPITLPPLHGRRDGLDRDVRWSAPVRSPQGEDFGLLMVCIRISSQPMDGAQPPPCAETRCPRINEPQHMERFSHVVQPWPGHADRPHAPCGVYGPLQWESEQHMNEAATRAWKHKCVVEAAPTVEHVRHVWDVLMGHAPSLDPGVARVGALFHNRPTQELTAEELKELMIALAFHATGINAAEAARFAFIALRRDVEDAVALEEVCYLFQHCLLPNTIEMSSGEIRRWVHDVFGGEGSGAVKFGDFSQHVLLNYAWWAALGVPVRVEHSASCAQKQHAMHLQAEVSRFADPLVAISNNNNNTTEVASAAAPPPPTSSSSPPRAEDVLLPPTSATSKDDVEWRTFIIRVQSSTTTTKNKCFSVTAHINDRVSDVMSMVEGSTNILAARQEWRWGEKIVDPATRVGQTTIGLASAMKMGGSGTQEVVVAELEESVVLHFVYKTKRWHEKFFMKDKIIKLRAAVQRRTLIPLSRCTLRYEGGAAGGGEVLLQDRHAVSHYKLRSGDVVVVLGD